MMTSSADCDAKSDKIGFGVAIDVIQDYGDSRILTERTHIISQSVENSCVC